MQSCSHACQFLTGATRLADSGSTLLGPRVVRRQVAVDILGRHRLLFRCTCDLHRRIIDHVDRLHDFLERLAGRIRFSDATVSLLLTFFHRLDRVARGVLQPFDHTFDLTGRFLGPLRQGAYLICDDGEAAALFSGAYRLDGRVQREQVGLFSDIPDYSMSVPIASLSWPTRVRSGWFSEAYSGRIARKLGVVQ